MNIVRQASSLLLIACCAMPLAPSAWAQATVLTGQVAAIDNYAGTTYVNPAEHAHLKSTVNAKNNRGGSGNLNGNAASLQNFHPQRPLIHTVYVRDDRTFFQKHPMVKSATIGAGVGAGAGALTGLVTGRGVIRGAVIGGGTGAGVGVVRSSQIMKRHPIVRDVATGSLVGLGLGASASRGHRLPLQATGVGAAIGLGVGLFKNLR